MLQGEPMQFDLICYKDLRHSISNSAVTPPYENDFNIYAVGGMKESKREPPLRPVT